MANKDDIIEATGVVVDCLPAATFKVKLDENDTEILAHISGRMRQNRIQILLGDKVRLEISVYDLAKGRITYREK